MPTGLKGMIPEVGVRMVLAAMRALRRRIYRKTRPASYPFISGDGFRRLANHVFDETKGRFQSERVRPGDIVFLATHMCRTFFREHAGHIEVPHTLITHNSDMPADKDLISLMGENVQAWYAQNNTFAHEKVIPIPIGIENLHHYCAGIPADFRAIRRRRVRKINRILVSFNIATNDAERIQALQHARKSPCADCLLDWLDQDSYLRRLSEYRFVLSPPGNGLDTHRTWEALYLGTIPIVGDAVAMRAFEAIGLPIWILPTWSDLRDLGEDALDAKYEAWERRFSSPAMQFGYWRRMIMEGAQRSRGNAPTVHYKPIP